MASNENRKAASKVTAGLVVLVIILGAVAAYAFAYPPAGQTTTVTQTGSAQTQTVTATSTVDRISSLVAGAAKEGAFTYYGTIDTGPFTQYIWNPFLKLFPAISGITLNFQVVFGSGVYTKMSAEYQSGNIQADAIDGFQCYSLNKTYPGILASYVSSQNQWVGYSTGAAGYDPNGLWNPYINAGPIVIGYNNKLVTPAQAPKDWADLANPQWGGGKIALNNPSINGLVQSTFAAIYDQIGNASATTIMQGIAANKPLITSGIGGAYDAISSGQASVGPIDLSDWVSSPASNRTVSVSWPTSFAGYRPNGICITAKAPHPNAARLFIEYLTSFLGMSNINNAGRPPQLQTLYQQHLVQVGMPSSEKLVPPPDKYLTNPTPYSAYFKNLFGL